MLCRKNISMLCSSHVLQLIESGLHGVYIVGLSGAWISWGRNLTLSSCDFASSLHGLLVAHLIEELHDLAVVD